MGFNSEYSQDNWGFIANEQRSGSVNGKIAKDKPSNIGRFLLKWPNRVLAKNRPTT